MNGPSSDRNLLLGIVALQMDFISRDSLIAAMHHWTLDKSRLLSEVLVTLGYLGQADRLVLESLVERRIAHNGGDLARSLSALTFVTPPRSTLESLGDPDIQQSLSKLGVTRTQANVGIDPEGTGPWGKTGPDAGSRYRILYLHDQGGLGSVFLARDAEVNREVALKQLKEEIASDQQCRARFAFEAEITGNLEHPGVVPVYGKGEYSDGRPYYAMRFIRGDNLKIAVDRLHKDPALKLDAGARHHEFQKLMRRFLVVCETISYAHSRGIIHRDLKPRNILLGPYGETLVVDWGLAKVVGHKEEHDPSDATLRPPSSGDVQETNEGDRLGTAAYMSPEQARGEVQRLGTPTDIYSLGATLYYMLTGRAPFTELDVPKLLIKVERGEFSPPREVKPGVARPLEAVCLRAMALLPEDRYSSPRALADDLEYWLADQPVSAYREPLSTRAMRWVRRRKQWVAAAALLVLLSLIGLALHDVRLGQEQGRTKSALEKLGQEQELTKQALEVARQERLRTKQALDQAAGQLKMTRDAYRELLHVSGTSLANIPQTEELRGRLASGVLENYKKLLASYPNDPDILFEMARVYKLIGGIDQITGQFKESEAAYQRSIDIFTRLADRPARARDAREWLAQTLADRGDLYHLYGKTRKAAEDLRAAVVYAGSLADDESASTHLGIKATALISLSEILALRGQAGESHAAANEAVALLESRRNRDQPASVADRNQWLLAMALTDRGSAARHIRGREAALADHRRALAELGKIQSNSDYFTSAQLQKATSLNELAELLDEGRNDHALAQQAFDQAIEIMEPLAKGSTNYPYYREALAISLAGRGKAHAAALRCPRRSTTASRHGTFSKTCRVPRPRTPSSSVDWEK